MDLAEIGDMLIVLFILLGLIFIIYARIKKQTLRDTWEEVKDLFTTKMEEN